MAPVDVLEYWEPKIDWKLFERGPLSSDVWDNFCAAVRLSNAFKHWSDAARNYRPSGEGTYGRRKRRSANDTERKGLTGHKYRAAFLAAEKIWGIAHLVQQRKDSPDWMLSLALIKSLGSEFVTYRIRGHEFAHFEVLAFNHFDAASEITQDPDAMAARWQNGTR
jgi:hypothetical protein